MGKVPPTVPFARLLFVICVVVVFVFELGYGQVQDLHVDCNAFGSLNIFSKKNAMTCDTLHCALGILRGTTLPSQGKDIVIFKERNGRYRYVARNAPE